MNIIKIIIQLIALFFKTWTEADRVKREAKKKVLKEEASNAIKTGDTTIITNMFDNINNRMR
jgi:hypothetical protein